MDLQYTIDALRAVGVEFETGLASSEISEIEHKFNFKFPPDLQSFLAYALPVSDGKDPQDYGKGFVNWRDESENDIRTRLSWPMEGVLLDVVDGRYWIAEWGQKPDLHEEAVEFVRNRMVDAPKLIPIYSHRYIPDTPSSVNNPILSAMQTDIIQYGVNLWNYFEHEFKVDLGTNLNWYNHQNTNKINFWQDIVFNN